MTFQLAQESMLVLGVTINAFVVFFVQGLQCPLIDAGSSLTTTVQYTIKCLCRRLCKLKLAFAAAAGVFISFTIVSSSFGLILEVFKKGCKVLVSRSSSFESSSIMPRTNLPLFAVFHLEQSTSLWNSFLVQRVKQPLIETFDQFIFDFCTLPPIWRTYLSVFRRCFALVLICTP
jgi:hypothetical protein